MIEAMSAGTPVIAFRNGSVPEVIADGVSGVLCDSMDDAVAAVHTVKSMSRAGVRRHFETQFTAECMVRKYVAVYESLLANQAEVIKLPHAAAFSPRYGDLNGSSLPSISVAAMPA
jgi:glycosyltransferase involved in cell wall biosynthesis